MCILFFHLPRALYFHNSTVALMISSKHASMEFPTPVLSLRGSTWLVSSIPRSTLLYSRMKDCLGCRYLTKTELHKGQSFLRVTFPSQIPRHVTKTCSLRMVKLNFHLTPWNNHLKTPNYHLEKPGARESKLPSLPDSRLTKREGYELRKCLRKLCTKPESALEVG